MAKIGLLYAGRHGQTAKIAERIGARLRAQGHAVDVVSCPRRGEPAFELARFDGVMVGSSVHVGRHHREIDRFVRLHGHFLASGPNAFFSVCLSARTPSPEAQRTAREPVVRTLALGPWRPKHVAIFAGALPYTRYGWLVRWMMKRIVKAQSGETDTMRDYEYTDWAAVDAFADAFGTEFTRKQDVAADLHPVAI